MFKGPMELQKRLGGEPSSSLTLNHFKDQLKEEQ